MIDVIFVSLLLFVIDADEISGYRLTDAYLAIMLAKNTNKNK